MANLDVPSQDEIERLFNTPNLVAPGSFEGSSLFCVGGMHNQWVLWFGELANRVVRGDARH